MGWDDNGLGSLLLGAVEPKEFKWTDLIPSAIKAGTDLAGIGFQQSAQKNTAEQYAQQAADQLAWDKEKFNKQLELDKMTAGNPIAVANINAEAARKNTLAGLYENWAQLTERGGEAAAKHATDTGEAMTRGLQARIAGLGRG